MALPFLAVFAVAAFCIFLSFAYDHSLGAALRLIARVFINATWNGPLGISIGFAFIGHAIESLDNAIRQALYAGIEGSEWAFHKMLHATAAAWQDIGDTMHSLALGTEGALTYLRRNVLPAAIRLYTDPLGVAIKALQQAVADIRPVVHEIRPAVTRTVYRDVPHALTKAEEAAIAALVKIPAAIHTATTIVQPAIDRGAADVEAIKRRLAGVTRTLTPAGIAGLVAASLFGALSLGWLKCSNVGKVGRSVCGLDAGLLDALLADALVIFGTLSLVELAEVMLDAMEELSGDVIGGWRETAGIKPASFQGYTGTLG